MTKNQKTRVTKLIAALRGGKYKQGKRRLRPTADTYCCFGVACDLSRKDEWHLIGEEYVYIDTGAILPESVIEFYGFADDEGVHFLDGTTFMLVEMNDTGSTFPQIADRIEYCLNHPETGMFV